MTLAPDEVLHFACNACGKALTVPRQMAGVTGPCPHCRNTVTSPTIPAAIPIVPTFAQAAPQPLPVQVVAQPPMPAQQKSAAAHTNLPMPGSSLWGQTTQPTALPNPAGSSNPSLFQTRSSAPWAESAPPTAEAKPSPLQSLLNHPALTGTAAPIAAPASAAASVPKQAPQTQAAPPQKRRRSGTSSQETRQRRVTLVGAFVFIMLALGGMGWFFRDQLKPFALQVLAHFKKTEASEEVVDAETIARLAVGEKKGSNPASMDPTAAPAPPPVSPVAKSGTPAASPETTPTPPSASVTKTTSPAVENPTASENERPAVPVPVAAPPIVQGTESLKNESQPPGPVPPPTMANNPPETKKALPVEESGTLSPVPPGTEAPKASPFIEVPSAPGTPTTLPASAASNGQIFVKASGESQPAAEALKKFFEAKTLKERLALTQAVEKVKPLMERYYEANPDGPIRVKSIELLRHDATPEIGTPLCVFQVSGPDVPEPLPVMAESTPEGWKVDWLTFTEFKDKLLLRYLQKWQDDPARFHVLMRRTHYFDEDVADLDKKNCFELTSPVPGFQGFAFVNKGTPLGQELDRTVSWDVSSVAAIVEVQWKKKDRYTWVEITALPQYNWRSTVAVTNPPPKAKPVEKTKTSSVAEKN